MEKSVIQVIKYFSIFKYPPNFGEIYSFFPKKTSRMALKKAILKLERRKKIKTTYTADLIELEGQRYTVGEYTTREYVRRLNERRQISKSKLANWKFRAYLRLISLLPQVKLVGLSGSISMLNAKKSDDIDLFIITSKKRLFTARFLCLILTQLFGLRRKFGELDVEDKVCLNLFFDEVNLVVPKHKRTNFVGHEVLQMSPLINKDHTYERFIWANRWVFKLFPNSKTAVLRASTRESIKSTVIGNLIEAVLKYVETKLINSHRTTELITDTQLWFHPDDFEKKINGKIK